ncbi:MAG: sulfate reduction electron transfer complex DsrMKJOP subunit DsrM [Desulfovibrio sp.]|uniref:sulfate reduction electron transfer complex DsrMKJOP subunit DsrM n=1 Tax=Desulfovibrio sp. 7SRBS1 TaxID=3378064 RepID=UPI003B3D92DE
MNAFYSLFLVFALILVALIGVQGAHLSSLFAIAIPYVAVAIFVVGFVRKVIGWAKSPVPFRIPTTGGQQKSFDWIEHNCIDNPSTVRGTIIRMFFEIFCFRSLFRNTKSVLYKEADGERPIVAYFSAKWLWAFALIFHYSFLVILLRHLRLFTEPVLGFVTGIEFVDGIMQIATPVMYMSDLMIIVGLLFLLGRRMFSGRIRYLSNAADFFALFLLLSIALSGIYMRYFAKVDIIAIKELTMGLVTFHPVIPENISASFYVHIFLVSVLFAYFPFSKLMHMGGVFLSPTRNMPNDTRFKHHENPWNNKVAPHSYAAYEDDFREAMVEAGLPVDKPLPAADKQE